MVKLYEELTISDDFMFGNAMGDKVVSRSGWICIRGIKSECTTSHAGDMPFCGQTETQMNSYKRWNNIVGWIVFAIAAKIGRASCRERV